MDDNNVGNDELISQFMAFTGTSDATKAASYLEMSGNDVETAVGLYMENEPHTTATTTSSSSGGVASSSPIGGGGGSGYPMMDDDIRAPDATRTMRLMDDPMMGLLPHHDPSYHMMNALVEEQFHQSAFSSPVGPINARAAVNAAVNRNSRRSSRNNSDDDDDEDEKENDDDDDEVYAYDDNDDEEFEDLTDTAAVQPQRLSDMFAPPLHLIHKAGGFTGARAMAKDTKRWLLVNIQSDSEFSSHALNRDVWRDELVENLIREGFIFWQQMDSTPEGRTYIERYQVQQFPHIGFIDPRTGRLLFRKEGWTQQNPLTAETFAELAMDFCSRNTFDKPPQAPRPPGAASNSTTSNRSVKRPMHEMSEAEQIQAAMRASMEDQQVTAMDSSDDVNNASNGGIVDITDETDDAVAVEDTKSAGVDEKSVASAAPVPPSSPNDEYLAVTVPDEPKAGARVQFRLPDGKRIVRVFTPSDRVKIIYGFITQSNDEAKSGKEFILLAGFPPKDLISNIDDTIDDVKLAGQAITMRWK